jgi:hypothetical protein
VLGLNRRGSGRGGALPDEGAVLGVDPFQKVQAPSNDGNSVTAQHTSNNTTGLRIQSGSAWTGMGVQPISLDSRVRDL